MNTATYCILFAIVYCSFALPKARNHVSSLHRPIFDPRKVATSELQPQYYTEQVIDHFSPNTLGTFSQKYYVNSTNWGGAGYPIFLILGGEGPISASDVDNHFIISEYAKNLNAMVISVEHRFYGETQPFNDTSTEHLVYLTTPQAYVVSLCGNLFNVLILFFFDSSSLADYAQFIQYISEYFECPTSPWISWGGSYSGSLSAWLRMKYPQLVIGAIASSAPVNALEVIRIFFFFFSIIGTLKLNVKDKTFF